MLIQKLDSKDFTEAYTILCQGIHPWQGVTETPFSTTWCVVGPGKKARAHKHQEYEAFVIVKGSGVMRVDEETAGVEPGDVIFMPPFSVHELRNTDAEKDLLFLDLCWEKLPEAEPFNLEQLRGTNRERASDVLVTATPPTPNGDFHLGHLSGPYFAADVFARYLRMRGVKVRYVTGMDDHQSYVVTKGETLGTDPREVAERFSDTMTDTLERASIAVDHIARPQSSPYHVELAREVFLKMYESGALVSRPAPTLYCECCERYLSEAHVSGGCPHCGQGSDGNACEACGRPNDCVDLESPRCRSCGGEPTVRNCERFYFPLTPYREKLEEFFGKVRMNAHMRSLCEKMLADGLPDIAVSHVSDWGIPVPVPGFDDQRIYVWFEMAPGYLAAVRELALAGGEERPEELVGPRAWGSTKSELVQFFGFDNGYFYAVLFPAIFLAYDPEIPLPTAFVTNELYSLEGAKFSTSRGHAIWGQDFLRRVPADVARFYLAYDSPETEKRDFTMAAFEATVRNELSGEWEGWLASLGARLEERFDAIVPGTGAWTRDHQGFYQDLLELNRQAAEAYEVGSFSPQRAARTLCEIVRKARRFGSAEEHWAGVPDRFEEERTAVALELLAARLLAQAAAPLMPDFAADLWRRLGQEGTVGEEPWQETPSFVPSGRRLEGLGRPCFAFETSASAKPPEGELTVAEVPMAHRVVASASASEAALS